MLQIKQWIKRRGRLLRGAYRTYLKHMDKTYNPIGWFNNHYALGISDRQTINQDTNQLTGCCHYASIELTILSILLMDFFFLLLKQENFQEVEYLPTI